METEKLGFEVVVGRPENGLDGRHTFVTMGCERSDTYRP